MDNLTLEVVKFIATGLLTLAGSIKVLGDRQTKKNEDFDERLNQMDRKSAEEQARITENVQRLREKIEQERIDFKERLKEITDYMYNRPR